MLKDVPAVREIVGTFPIEALETSYTIGGKGPSKRITEVLISNFR